ncbi:MAG TPA: 3-dehydroquinate synthase [Pyrinomonadaceae bacterium]|nr:3-dehydroquinate synthase [Pyrinomonadaceae bacterium]
MPTVKVSLPREATTYDIKIGSGSLSSVGEWTRRSAPDARRVCIVSNPVVFGLYGDGAARCLTTAQFEVSSFLMKDGERNKTLRTAESALAAFSDAGLERSDVVVALGGGVVGDLAGFAAALYLRGIRFIQVPTTLLAMVDSSVGGKTGVNTSFGKNLTGAFHQPAGVLIDPRVLSTLPTREMTAGFCEVIKHGALAGYDLLDSTADLLGRFRGGPAVGLENRMCRLIKANVEFKASIVAADERESSKRRDPRSRKILNFGHTLAHALEKVTNYRYFLHGEAVGYGISFAAELSKNLALSSQEDVNLLNDVVRRAGVLPSLTNIDPTEVLAAFRSDKKVIGGELQMVLLRGIGKPAIVSERDIPHSILKKTLIKLFR